MRKNRIIIICIVFLMLFASSCGRQVRLDITDPHVRNEEDYAFAIYNTKDRLITDPIGRLGNKLTNLDKNQSVSSALDKSVLPNHLLPTNSSLPSEFEEKAKVPISDVYLIAHGWNYTLSESIEAFQKYIDLIDSTLGRKETEKDFHPFFVFITWPSAFRPLTGVSEAVLPLDLDEGISWITNGIDMTVFFFPTVWKQSINAHNIALGDVRSRSGNKICGTSLRLSNTEGFNENGMEIPVASLLCQLIEENQRRAEGKNPTYKIHLIGHSFGAKLVSVSAIQALTRWSSQFDVGGSQSERPTQLPIESMILFNPAFNINELEVSTLELSQDRPHTAILKNIQKKAIVYTNFDYPNGMLFDVSQLPVNTFWIQNLQQILRTIPKIYKTLLADIYGDHRDMHSFMNAYSDFTYNYWNKPLTGLFYLALSIPFSVLDWTFSKIIDLPGDLKYHILHGDRLPQSDNAGLEIFRYAFNGIHFFMPIDRFFGGAPEDQWGLFRSTKPALGRTGLNRLYKGRIYMLSTLGEFIDESEPSSTEISAETMCELSQQFGNVPIDQNSGETKLKIDNKFIYSFDASGILNTNIPFLGAHGDLRSEDVVDKCPNPNNLQKRQFIMNFVYNFTRKVSGVQPQTPSNYTFSIPQGSAVSGSVE